MTTPPRHNPPATPPRGGGRAAPRVGPLLVPVALLLLLVWPAPGRAAPSNAPSPAPAAAPVGRFDDTALRRGGDAGSSGPGGPQAPSSGFDLPRVVLALGAVVGLIFALRWVTRRFFGLPSARRSSQAVQVLSRTVLSPRQQLVLLKVGRRVIVAADGGSQVTSLSEITDPDEVAALLGQLRSEHDADALPSPARAFNSLLGRLKNGYGAGGPAEPRADEADFGDEAGADPEPPAESDDEEDAPAPAAHSPRGRPAPPAGPGRGDANVVAATREELSGLMARVRLVSDQFSGPKARPQAREGKPSA